MNWLLLAAVELALSYFRRRAFETSGQPEHLTAFGAKSLGLQLQGRPSS